MSDSGSEEETYSLMFSSLRHPARRKILRMLSEKTMTFSQMLEELAIPSSHLTYHLENLGELVLKDKDGKYKLSSFGKASVAMMKGAEEVPNGKSSRFSNFPLRWKAIFAIFAIGIVLLASISYVEFASMNNLNNDYNKLSADYNSVQAQNQQILSWSPSNNLATVIIKDVIQIDVSKYPQTILESNTAQIRTDLGGVIEEIFTYKIANTQSSFDLTLTFRNGHFWQFVLTQEEGYPNYPMIYTQPQSGDILQATKDLINRYKSVDNDTYLDQAAELLAVSNETANDQTLGNTKLSLSIFGANSEAMLMYTENGTDFKAKSLHVVLANYVVTSFTDDWFLYNVGSTQVNVSQDQAILIAKNAAKTFSWNANGTQVTNFQILDNPISVIFYPHPKTGYLTLYPYWVVTLYLDKAYPGDVNQLSVGIWADTGKVEAITLGGQVNT
ncbi:MAG TPA: winged helix-turn-helix domain-containing protein [Candidatus Nanoarchaeia archaeon]|nr:winged helix-turn-helix domain-containing protein [Candidatus Nanoarchaeia archaeon]